MKAGVMPSLTSNGKGGFIDYINELMQECATQLSTRHTREMEELTSENERLKSHIKMYGLPLPTVQDTNLFSGPVLRSALKTKKEAAPTASPSTNAPQSALERRKSALKSGVLPAGFRRISEQQAPNGLMNGRKSLLRSNSLNLNTCSSGGLSHLNPRSLRAPGSRKVSLQVGCEGNDVPESSSKQASSSSAGIQSSHELAAEGSPSAASPSTLSTLSFLDTPQTNEAMNILSNRSSMARSSVGSVFDPEVTCHACGNIVHPDAMFCQTCGTKRQNRIECHACGNQLMPDAIFCGQCGEKRQSLEGEVQDALHNKLSIVQEGFGCSEGDLTEDVEIDDNDNDSLSNLGSDTNKPSVVQEERLEKLQEEPLDNLPKELPEKLTEDPVEKSQEDSSEKFKEDPLSKLVVGHTSTNCSSSSSQDGVDKITNELARIAAEAVPMADSDEEKVTPLRSDEEKVTPVHSDEAKVTPVRRPSVMRSMTAPITLVTPMLEATSDDGSVEDCASSPSVSPPPGMPKAPAAPNSAAPRLTQEELDFDTAKSGVDFDAAKSTRSTATNGEALFGKSSSMGAALKSLKETLGRPLSANKKRSDTEVSDNDTRDSGEGPSGSFTAALFGGSGSRKTSAISDHQSRKNSQKATEEGDDDERRPSWARGLLRKTSAGVNNRRISVLHAVKKTLKFADDKSDGSSSSESEEEVAAVQDHDDDEEDEMTHFWLSPIWEERSEKAMRKTAVNINIGKMLENICENGYRPEEDKEGKELEDELVPHQRSRVGAFMDRLMIHPMSRNRLFWAIVGGFFLLWDIVVIPMHYFDVGASSFLVFMSWTIRLYWNFDIFVSMLTGGVGEHGVVDMTPEWAILRYIRTWMTLDVGMVTVEWLVFAGEISESVRMLRILWYFKVNKTVDMSEEIKSLTAFRSEQFMIMLGIIKVVTAILAVNHLIACFWYGIGTIGNEDNEDTWVYQMGYTRASKGDLYSTSFLWSLTQFMGSTAIQPHNSVERIFAIFVLLFAIVFSAFAVSSITTSMTRLQIVTAQQSTQSAMLRMYLASNHISSTLSSRIQRSAQNALEHLARNTPESKIELLEFVSDPLRVELHYEVNAPVLLTHPFFRHYDAVYAVAMRQVCHEGVSKVILHRGDLVFSNGEMPTGKERMYFLTEGRLLYLHNDVAPKNLKAGAWACEAALWTLFPHRGSMRAKSDCDLVYLDAAQFQKTTCQFLSKNANPVHYGTEFVRHLNQKPRNELSDLNDDSLDKETIAFRVFSGMEANANRTSRLSASGIPRLSGNSMLAGMRNSLPGNAKGKVSAAVGPVNSSSSNGIVRTTSGTKGGFVTKTLSTGNQKAKDLFHTLSLHIPAHMPGSRGSRGSTGSGPRPHRGSGPTVRASKGSIGSAEGVASVTSLSSSNTLTVPSSNWT